jgi:hypothetical protein
MAHTVYTYSDSLVGSGDIRILHLHAGTTSDLLAGDIERRKLEDCQGSYQAISYEWGSADKTHAIAIGRDGLELPITASLHNALRDIRNERPHSGETCVVWVDSVCINQSDKIEREYQVSKMGDIFRSARNVLTYIGPEQDDSALAIEFATQLRQWGVENKDSPDPRLHMPEHMESLGLPVISDPCWKAIEVLILRTWVSRCHPLLYQLNVFLPSCFFLLLRHVQY